MRKIICYLSLALLLLSTGVTHVWAEEQLPPKLQKLTDEAYRCYSTRDTENFFEAISLGFEDAYKAIEEFVGDAEPSDDLTKMCIIMK